VVKMWGYRYKDSFGQNEILGLRSDGSPCLAVEMMTYVSRCAWQCYTKHLKIMNYHVYSCQGG
jgi:hypothetical protein